MRVGDDINTRMARAWRDLRRGASTAVVRDVLFGTGPDAIEPNHMDVLDLLVQRDRWRMSELASALRIDPSTITRSIQRMEDAGLARRMPDPADGRVVTVTTTVDGARRHAIVAARRESIVEHIMTPLSEAERVGLVELLERFLTSLDDYVERLTSGADPSIGRVLAPNGDLGGDTGDDTERDHHRR